MTDNSQIMDSVIATPRASSNGSVFWVTPTQYNPQTGTYQTHYYSDDLVKSGTVSVGTPTWKNNSVVPQVFSSSGANKSVAAPILIPPPQSKNLANFEDPIIRIPEGIKELEYEEEDDDQSVVDIKQLNQSYDYESENGDHSNRAKNVVDAVVALGHVLVKDLQKAVPNLAQSGSSIFETCLGGSGIENELIFSPKNILRDTLKNNNQIKPHLLPNGVTLQELLPSNQNIYGRDRKNKNSFSSTLMVSELFYDQIKFPRMSLISYDPSSTMTNGLVFEKETIKHLNSDFGDSPLCFISLIDCSNELFSKLLLIPDLESSTIYQYIRKINDQKINNSLVDLYYWYKDEEFIYILLDFKLSLIPKLHDLLLLLANSISSCVVMNNIGIINQDSLIKLSPIVDLQREFENRQESKINKLLRDDVSNSVNSSKSNINVNEGYNTPKKVADSAKDEFKSIQDNPLLLLTPRYKPSLKSESNNNLKKLESEIDVETDQGTPRTLLCTLKTTPRPCLVWLLHDFNYLLYDNTNNMIWNSIDYFETLLNELGCGYECDESKISYFETLKLYLKSYYKMKECHTLVSSYSSENSDKIRIDYLKQVSCFRQRLLGISKIHALNHKIGQYNSSLTIKRFLSVYFEVINNKSINNLSEMHDIIQRKFCDKILLDICDYYLNEHKKLIDILPMNDFKLKENIQEIKTRCLHLYNEYTSTLIDTDIYIDYKIKLQSNLENKEDETIKENSELSSKYCTTYLKEVSDKTIIKKLYDSNKQYLILNLEKDLENLYKTMLNNLNDKIPKEIYLNCFLKLANELRHEWYEINGGDNRTLMENIKDRIGIENCFGTNINNNRNNSQVSQRFDSNLLKKIETPEMLVNRLNLDLEEIDSEYNCYSLMQKKELLEDILLEATKKKDRLSDFYSSNELYSLDRIINAVQDRLDVVNTERKSIIDNNEIQRQMMLKKKQKRWRKIFPCLNKGNKYNINEMPANHSLNQNENY